MSNSNKEQIKRNAEDASYRLNKVLSNLDILMINADITPMQQFHLLSKYAEITIALCKLENEKQMYLGQLERLE